MVYILIYCFYMLVMWIKTSFPHFMANGQAIVVQKLDSAIHWINYYSVDKY